MPQQNALTYGQLHAKLKELGFREGRVELDGKRGRVFERQDLVGSMIVLPERDPNDLVEPFYLRGVLFALKRLDLVPETNPLLT